MGFWKSIRRALGGQDSQYWRVAGLAQMRLRGDIGVRAIFGLLVGIGAAAPINALLIVSAPPGSVGIALGLAAGMSAVLATLAFLWRDAAQIIVSLEDGGIRLSTRQFLANPFGTRDSEQFWDYRLLSGVGIVPAANTGIGHAALVVAGNGGYTTLLISPSIDPQQVAAALAARRIAVQALPGIPPAARPAPSIASRGLMIGGGLAAFGLLICAVSAAARPFVHGGGAAVNLAGAQATLDATPAIAPTRFWTGVDGGAVDARMSSDGNWLWARAFKTKRELIWNAKQEQPVGELKLDTPSRLPAVFTPDNRQVVTVDGSKLKIWTLDPVALDRELALPQAPDAFFLTADGKRVWIVTMVWIQSFDFATGAAGPQYKQEIGAVVAAGMAADGRRVITVHQNRIVATDSQTGASEILVKFDKPTPSYGVGSFSPGGKFAAMQSLAGTDLFEIATKTQSPSLPTGPIYSIPRVTAQDGRLVVPALKSAGVWDIATSKPIAQLNGGPTQLVAPAPDGRSVLGFAADSDRIGLWTLP